MTDVIKVLQKEIIEAQRMLLDYEKIRLQNLEDGEENYQVIQMIRFYSDRIRKFDKAIELLKETE